MTCFSLGPIRTPMTPTLVLLACLSTTSLVSPAFATEMAFDGVPDSKAPQSGPSETASAAAKDQIAQAAQSFNIPPQSLEASLEAFSEATGWQVGAPGDLMKDRLSPGVSGDFAPEEALRRLLVGSGVTYRTSGDRSVVLSDAARTDSTAAGDSSSDAGSAAGPIALSPIVVEGDAGVVTEGTGSYATNRATVGGKQPADVRDVPQSVSVVTRQRLDDAQANSLENAGYLMPNVTTAMGDLFHGSLYSRGHEVFTYNVDGAPRPYLSIYGTAPDLAFFDRVELLSGPSGVFQGSGEPVGTVNLVRKRALKDFQASAAASYGTFGSWRGESDVTGALLDDGSLRTRFVAYGETKGSYVDVSETDKIGTYGTFEYDVTDQTTLSFGGTFEHQDSIRFAGLPRYTDGSELNVDRNTFIGADWNDFVMRNYEAFLEIEHSFDFGGVLKAAARHYDRDVRLKTALASSGVDKATGDFTMYTFSRDYKDQASWADINLTTPFTLLGKKGEVTVGTDLRVTDAIFKQAFGPFTAQNINTFQSNALTEPDIDFDGVSRFSRNTVTDGLETGVYTQGRIGLTDALKVTLGARFASYESETYNTATNVQTSKLDENRFIPSAGLTYDVLDPLTVYAGYSEIFQPQTEQTSDGAQLEPIIGRQFEIGAKAALFDEALTVQSALFWLRDQNRAEDDPDDRNASIASGNSITRGAELLVTGSPVKNVDISVGYNYVDAELNSDPSPVHSAMLFGKYNFTDGVLDGLSLGAGMRVQGAFSRIDERANTKIKGDGYTVFDAMASYDIHENLSVGARIENIFDAHYVERVNEVARGNFYGKPLNASLQVKAKF